MFVGRRFRPEEFLSAGDSDLGRNLALSNSTKLGPGEVEGRRREGERTKFE